MILTATPNTSIDKLYMLDSLEPYTVMRVRQVKHGRRERDECVPRGGAVAVAGSAASALFMGTGGYDPADFQKVLPQVEIIGM